MHIKKLSIRGFKSFMDRLEIPFPKGVSAVVGPNGCGKSNIVDAIRWCLGEQSPRQLRGLRMEDVIFNGAGDYKPFGMAEVSLLFENDDGALTHPNFANDPEIAVTRRLYRSGESEYLINNVPCRLKDIQEILMDTGLGNKAYSIIGQGRIGAILEQRPEETRVMLEEAAGITKYRHQVELSQKKIELTQGNLQRVEDILGEIDRQMRALRRQAAKARRYKAATEEIEALELTLAANTYHQMEGELDQRLRSSEALVNQEIERSAALSQVHAKIAGLNFEREEAEKGLQAFKQRHAALKDTVHQKETLLESLAGEIRMQAEIARRLEGEASGIRVRLEQLALEKAGLEVRIEENAVSARDLQGDLALGRERLKGRRDMFKGIKAEYDKVREEVSSRDKRRAGLLQESGHLQKMLEQITDRRSRLEAERESVSAKMQKIMAASEARALTREAAAEKLREIEMAFAAEADVLAELEQVRKGAEAEARAAEGELNLVQTRLAGLESLLDNFEGYQLGVRTIMRAQDLPLQKEGRILGLLSDVIEVEPCYEQAVEAVLAEKLQYVIVTSQEDGRQAIEYLKREARGRSSFVPLDDLGGRNGNGRKQHPGARPLLEIISAAERYQPLLQALLGQTLLVDDLETALGAWKANGKDVCFVTADGDIVDERGVISGGRLSRVSKGLLARKRETAELKTSLEAGRRKVAELRGRFEQIEMEIEERRSARQALEERKWEARDELNDLDKVVFRLSQEVDQLQMMSERVDEDLQRKEHERHRHQNELGKIREALDLCVVRQEQEEACLREKGAELKAAEGEVEELRESLARAESDERLLQEARRGILRELEHLDAYAAEAGDRLYRIREDLALGEEKRALASEKRDAVKRDLVLIYEDLQEVQEWVDRKEGAFQEIVNAIKVEEGAAEKLRGEIQDLKERINRARMAHSEIRFQMKALGEKVRENFNLDLTAIFREHLIEPFSPGDLDAELKDKRAQRQALGEVNLTAIREYEALKERYEFIQEQRQDLVNSIESLRTAIRRINRTSIEKFRETFAEVDRKLKEIFPILFNGGEARLKLTDEEKPLESGVLVEVQPPGKRLSHMGLLSGGEKALVAMALLFAIYMIKPSPFCLLDEVDAPLDEANVDRFNNLILEIKRASQIIMVTHSRKSMAVSDRLFGVTMEQAGVSKLVSVDLEKVKSH